MKRLSILRHAKAEESSAASLDFERKLTDRGQQDLYPIRKVLKHLKPPVEWILSSPALRCQQTTDIIKAVLHNEPYVNWQTGIYEASPGTLLRLLTEIPDGIDHGLLIGHNPGLEELISGLCIGEATNTTIQLATATLAHLELEIFSWSQLRWGCGNLQFLLPAKLIRG